MASVAHAENSSCTVPLEDSIATVTVEVFVQLLGLLCRVVLGEAYGRGSGCGVVLGRGNYCVVVCCFVLRGEV